MPDWHPMVERYWAGAFSSTAYQWLDRFRREGWEGLRDRCSRPQYCPHATSSDSQDQVVALRHARHTYRQISQELGIGHSTVAHIRRRKGLNRLRVLEPAPLR